MGKWAAGLEMGGGPSPLPPPLGAVPPASRVPACSLGDASSTSLGRVEACEAFLPSQGGGGQGLGGAPFVPSEELGQVPGPGPAGACGVNLGSEDGQREVLPLCLLGLRRARGIFLFWGLRAVS